MHAKLFRESGRLREDEMSALLLLLAPLAFIWAVYSVFLLVSRND